MKAIAPPYTEIAGNLERMTEAQWKNYVDQIVGAWVTNWTGWIDDVNEKASLRSEPAPLGLSPRRELGRTLGAKARGRFAVTQRNRRPGDGAQSSYTFLCHERTFGGYELWIDMDPLDEMLSVYDVTFNISDEVALQMTKDNPITFSGKITAVTDILGVGLVITLEEAEWSTE